MSRRLATVKIAEEYVARMLEEGRQHPTRRVFSGLPVGARLVGAQVDARLCILVLTFEHESFDPVEGEPPQIQILLEQLRRPK